MWQEPWGKVELLFVMWVDEPKFLICAPFLCNDGTYLKLVVKIKVIFIVWQQLSSCQQCIDKQIVKVGSHVEVVAFARIRPVALIRCGQFTNGPKYCVCAACTEVWV